MNNTQLPKLEIIFTKHAKEQMSNRQVKRIDVENSVYKCPFSSCIYSKAAKDTILINKIMNHSIVLNIKHIENIYYVHVVTVMNFIPQNKNGSYRFYDYSKLIVL